MSSWLWRRVSSSDWSPYWTLRGNTETSSFSHPQTASTAEGRITDTVTNRISPWLSTARPSGTEISFGVRPSPGLDHVRARTKAPPTRPAVISAIIGPRNSHMTRLRTTRTGWTPLDRVVGGIGVGGLGCRGAFPSRPIATPTPHSHRQGSPRSGHGRHTGSRCEPVPPVESEAAMRRDDERQARRAAAVAGHFGDADTALGTAGLPAPVGAGHGPGRTGPHQQPARRRTGRRPGRPRARRPPPGGGTGGRPTHRWSGLATAAARRPRRRRGRGHGLGVRRVRTGRAGRRGSPGAADRLPHRHPGARGRRGRHRGHRRRSRASPPCWPP